jgi:hypothetical protein
LSAGGAHPSGNDYWLFIGAPVLISTAALTWKAAERWSEQILHRWRVWMKSP